MRVYGHRGARRERPENTLAGFHHALALGCDGLELDLQLSADNVLMVIHDDTLERTTNGRGRVREHTAASLRSLDAGDGEPVLSIDEMFDACPTLDYVQLETKPVASADREHVVDALVKLFERPGLAHRAIVTSFDHDLLMALKRREAGIPVGLVSEPPSTDPLLMALSLGARVLAVDKSMVNQELVRSTRDAGLELSVWTVNEVEEAQRLAALGVDSLITDVPSTLLPLFS